MHPVNTVQFNNQYHNIMIIEHQHNMIELTRIANRATYLVEWRVTDGVD